MENTDQQICPNCGNEFNGHYCSYCGEKKPDPKHDFSLKEFITESLDHLVHFDSRLLRTFKYLLFKPGYLTSQYMAGRRITLMRPLQVFIISSLLFYFFMPRSSSFYESIGELQEGYTHKSFNIANPLRLNVQAKLQALVKQPPDGKVLEANKTGTMYAKIEDKAAEMSKTWLFLLVPLWAFFVYALFYRRNNYYIPHLIFTLHLFSFFLITDLLSLILLFDVLNFQVIKTSVHLLPLILLVWAYISIAIKKCYAQTTINAIWKGLIVFAGLLLLLIFYRSLITSIAIMIL